MNIALIGYGKMGKIIEQIALERDHQVVLKISSSNTYELTAENIRKADVAIEFTRADVASSNVLACLNAGIPVVCGTTGWTDALEPAYEAARNNNTAFLHATNFSIGVNLFFELNKVLARLMNNQDQYEPVIEETHHTQKLDAPSGTAITLAEGILDQLNRKTGWAMGTTNTNTLKIQAHRIEGVPGTHMVKYSSEIDSIEIVHTAHNRLGFAQGAVAAAEFLKGKAGIFSMSDVLGL